MYKRGGGVVDLRFRQLSGNMGVAELYIDVREAMGANIINTLAEAIAPRLIESIGHGRFGLRILSNYNTERLVKTEF